MLARLTTADRSGLFTGTLMISIRISDEFASRSGVSRTQPGSSLGERMPAEPEMYT